MSLKPIWKAIYCDYKFGDLESSCLELNIK